MLRCAVVLGCLVGAASMAGCNAEDPAFALVAATANASSDPFCGAPAEPFENDTDRIELAELLRRARISSTVDALLDDIYQSISWTDRFAKPLLWTSVYHTRSNQPASILAPRLILLSRDLLMAAQPGDQNDATKPASIEVLHYECEKRTWAPYLIQQVHDEATPKLVVYDATSTSPFGGSGNLKSFCASCHGSDIHPNWAGYPQWPGAIPSFERVFDRDGVSDDLLLPALARETQWVASGITAASTQSSASIYSVMRKDRNPYTSIQGITKSIFRRQRHRLAGRIVTKMQERGIALDAKTLHGVRSIFESLTYAQENTHAAATFFSGLCTLLPSITECVSTEARARAFGETATLATQTMRALDMHVTDVLNQHADAYASLGFNRESAFNQLDQHSRSFETRFRGVGDKWPAMALTFFLTRLGFTTEAQHDLFSAPSFRNHSAWPLDINDGESWDGFSKQVNGFLEQAFEQFRLLQKRSSVSPCDNAQ